MKSRLAVGFSVHTGWAAAVTLAGAPPRLLDRQRVALCAPEERFVFHLAAKDPAHAAALVAKAKRRARDRAGAFLREVVEAHPEAKVVVALPPPRARPLPPLEEVLRSHPQLHAAEGVLFREAIAEAAEALGLEVARAADLPEPPLERPGPPWGADQRTAAARAFAALH